MAEGSTSLDPSVADQECFAVDRKFNVGGVSSHLSHHVEA